MESSTWMPEATGVDRRIPIYLLVDSSTSMGGDGISAVNDWLPRFQSDVVQNSFARDSVCVGLITFGSDAELVGSALVPITQFQAPYLTANGVTRLDRAFEILRQSLDRDIKRPIVGQQKGDGRPFVFIFTDGQPTDQNGNLSDNWRNPRDRVVSDRIGGLAPKGTVRVEDIYTVGCGQADENTLLAISTGMAFKAGQDVAFSSFIKLVTMVSIMSAERQGAGAQPDQAGPILTMDDLPPDLLGDVVVP